jgi:hypothetical protein
MNFNNLTPSAHPLGKGEVHSSILCGSTISDVRFRSREARSSFLSGNPSSQPTC